MICAPLPGELSMKMGLTVGLIMTSASLLASEYEITRFAASDYRSYSTAELSSHIGSSQELLSSYACNQSDEYDPFSAPLRYSFARSSLKVKVVESDLLSGEEFLTYREGHFFDSEGNEVTTITDPFAKSVADAFERLETIEPAAKLLRHLEESYYPLTIRPGGNRFDPQTIDGKMWSGMRNAKAIVMFQTLVESDLPVPLTDIGSGGRVYWNPKLEITSIESDGVRRKLDSVVALAHELYHSFDSIRGILDMGKVSGPGYEFESVMEYRAVYFENIVRKAFGIKLRKHYGDGTPLEGQDRLNPPDLLDESGETIYIPSPC